MIFSCLDFDHSTRYGEEPVRLLRPFRLLINYIVDSFTLRIPKKTRTLLFRKLTVCVVDERRRKDPFFTLLGCGCVELVVPSIKTIYQATPAQTIKLVKTCLRRGIRIAAKHDRLFAKKLDVWEHLLSTVDEEFDYDLRLTRSHRSRRWRCNAVLRITPNGYHYDVIVKNSRTHQIVGRHRIKKTEYRGIGFSKIRWDKEEIVGLTRDDKEVFRFEVKLPD